MRLIFVLLLLISFKSNSQILYGGNHIIEPYLGLPNMARFTGGMNFFNNGSSSGQVTKFRGFAPSGLRYSYMISDDVSFGFDLIYNYSNVTSSTTDTLYNGVTGQWEYQKATAQDITKRLRFQARVNFHIQTSNPESDSYFGIGFGTNNRWISSYNNAVFQKTLKGSDASILPFSMRLCYGYRHYFGYNWGIVGEVGLGGPLLSFGVSYKM